MLHSRLTPAHAPALPRSCFMASGGGYEGCAALAERAVAAAPGLPVSLAQVVLGGEPISLLALNCLTYLALSPKVTRREGHEGAVCARREAG